MVTKVVKEMMLGEYTATGPRLGSSSVEKELYTKPLWAVQLEAPVKAKPQYLVYPIGGDLASASIYNALPPFVPTRFECKLQYAPIADEGESSQGNQLVLHEPRAPPAGRKTQDTEAEKLEWLSKYSDRPNAASLAESPDVVGVW